MVMAQALFQRLHQQAPTVTLDVLAPEWSRGVLQRMPEVNRVWSSPGGHGELALLARYRLGRELRAERYDWAVMLRNSWKSALVPFWAKIPKRTGWLGESRYGLLNDWRRLDKARYPRMLDRFCALALPANAPPTTDLPLPRLQVTADSVVQTLQALQLTAPTQPVLILCPGAEYGPAKRWPASHFAAVARAKLQAGWTVWLLGAAKEAALTAAIQAETQGQCVDLAGRTTLSQVIDLMSMATYVVSNDSGLMHIAAAVGVSMVVVYGSSSPQFTPPLTPHCTTLQLDLACSPCFKRVCPFTHTNCLQQLSPQRVLAAME